MAPYPPLEDGARAVARTQRLINIMPPSQASEVKQHLHVGPQCGLCGDLFAMYETILVFAAPRVSIAVAYGNMDGVINYQTGSGKTGTWFSTYAAFCHECRKTPSPRTVHPFCLDLYLGSSDSCPDRVGRLWHILSSRTVYDGGPSLLLPPTRDVEQIAALASMYEDTRRISTLPPEIRDMIARHLCYQSSTIAKHSAVVEIVKQAKRFEHVKNKTFKLETIRHWRRGEMPTFVDEVKLRNGRLATRPVIRIDWEGIQSIDLEDRPLEDSREAHSPCTRSSGNGVSRYMWADERIVQPGKIDVTFEGNTCQLTYLFDDPFKERVIPTMWNAPTLPCPQKLHYNMLSFPQVPRLRDLEETRQRLDLIFFDSCDAITFFYSNEGAHLEGVHAHTSKNPTAVDTYRRLLPKVHVFKNVEWIYVPLNGAVRVFGARLLEGKVLGYIIDMGPGGLVYVGQNTNAFHREDITYKTPPEAGLICAPPSQEWPPRYSRRRDGTYRNDTHQGAQILGLYGAEGDAMGSSMSPHLSMWLDNDIYLDETKTCFSEIVFNKPVKGVYIYFDPSNGFCRGLLFENSDGSKLAMGSCRVGVDQPVFCPGLDSIEFATIEEHTYDYALRRYEWDENTGQHEPVASKAFTVVRPVLPHEFFDNQPWSNREWDWYNFESGDTVAMWFAQPYMELVVSAVGSSNASENDGPPIDM